MTKGTNQAGSGTTPLTKPKQKDSEFFSFPYVVLPNSVYLDICLALSSSQRGRLKGEIIIILLKATVKEDEKKKREMGGWTDRSATSCCRVEGAGALEMKANLLTSLSMHALTANAIMT